MLTKNSSGPPAFDEFFLWINVHPDQLSTSPLDKDGQLFENKPLTSQLPLHTVSQGDPMKRLPLIVASLLLMFLVTSYTDNAQAESGDIALGAHISTLGVGPDLTIGLMDSLNLKAAGNWGSYDVDGESDDIDYDCDLELISGLVAAEWLPFSGRSFHIVAGALFNGNNLEASAEIRPGLSYDIGGTPYSSDQIGRLEGDIEYNSVAPYIGIGWGNPVHKDSTVSFFIDIGVVYQGAAEVSLDAYGTLANDPTFLSHLQQEEDDLEDDLDDFKYYPVISLGLTYKF